MSKKCISIEYNSSYCRLIQARRTSNGVYAEKTAIIHKDKFNELSEEMQQLGFNKRLPVVVTVSPEKCHYMNIDSDQDLAESNDDSSKSSPAVKMDNAIQIQLPEIHKLAGSNPSSLVITVEKSEIEKIKDLCKANALRCCRIELPIFALMAANKKNILKNEWMQLYISNSRMTIAVLSNDSLLLVRNIPLPYQNADISSMIVQELQLSWRTAFGIHIPEDTKIILINNHIEYPELDSYIKNELMCQVHPITQSQDSDYDKNIESPEQFIIPIAAANIYFRPNDFTGMNLSKSIKEDLGKQKISSQYKYTAALLFLVVFLFIISLKVNNYRLNNTHNKVNSDITTLFNNSIPGQAKKNLVPKIMLSIMNENESKSSIILEKLTKFENERLDWIPLLDNISKAKPEMLKINTISLDSDTIQINVSADNNNISKFKASLEDTPGLNKIEVGNIIKNNVVVSIYLDN